MPTLQQIGPMAVYQDDNARPTGQGWSTTSCSSPASTEWSGQHAVPISTRLRTSGMSWIAKSGATTPLPGMPNIFQILQAEWQALLQDLHQPGQLDEDSLRRVPEQPWWLHALLNLWEHPNTLFCDFINFGKSNLDTYPLGSYIHTKQLLEIE